MIQLLFIFSDWAFLLLRVVLGTIFIAHGWPKINDLKGTFKNFEMMGFKPGFFWGLLIALLEFVGGLFLIIGLLVQPLGILFVMEMLVAILMVKRKLGLVSGYELDIVILAASLVLATVGGGALTLDEFLNLRLY